MKICYLSDELSISDYHFLSKLVENNFDTYLVTYSSFAIPESIKKITGLHILHFRSRFKGRLFYYLYCLKIFHFRRILKKIRPNILHAGLVTTCGFLGTLSKFHPFLLMPWGSDILVFPNKSFIHRALVKYVLKRPDMITCDCESVKKRIIEISKFPGKKIVVFPRGIDLSLFNPQNMKNEIRKKFGWQDKKILIMTRAFKPVYGIEYFLESLSLIIKEEPNCRAILVGSGPLEKRLKEIVREKKLDQFVSFAGFISHERLPAYLNSADIYISSSLSDGSSLSLMEAMACGLPVVVTDLPANREWIEDNVNGYLVPPKNIEVLASRIISLLKNKEKMEEMGRLNLSRAQKKSDWNKNFKKLERTYETLLKTHKECM